MTVCLNHFCLASWLTPLSAVHFIRRWGFIDWRILPIIIFHFVKENGTASSSFAAPPPPPPTPPRHPKASLPGLMYFLNCEILMSRDRLGCHSIARSISLSVAREAQTYFRWSLISLRILTFLEGEKRRPEIRLRFAGYFNYLQFMNMIYFTRLFYFRYRVFSKLMISPALQLEEFFCDTYFYY